MLHRPQSLNSSSGSTTPIGRSEPPATRPWCFTAHKSLFLRPEAPRHLVRLSLRRPGRGASLPANPYSFVRKHHAYRPVRASGDSDVVPHCPQILTPSSGSTTPPGPIEPPAAGAWCFTARKSLLLRPEALRQHGPAEPPATRPWCFTARKSLILIPSSGSTTPNGSVRRRLCWRRPPCKTLTLRRTTPTWSGFSRPAGASVGVALPAKP